MVKKTSILISCLCFALLVASCTLNLGPAGNAQISFAGLSRSALAPSGFTVKVSGPGMATVVQSFASGSSATLSVPVGRMRTITVRAAQSDGFILEKAASVTRDLVAGENAIDLQLLASKTKIAVTHSDGAVVLDDISGAGRVAIAIENFSPQGLDFDNDGNLYLFSSNQIYKASYGADGWQTGAPLFDDQSYDFSAIAIDRASNTLYAAVNNNQKKIWSASLSNGSFAFDMAHVLAIGSYDYFVDNALALDPDGNLYFAYVPIGLPEILARTKLGSGTVTTLPVNQGESTSPFYAYGDGESPQSYMLISGLKWSDGTLLVSANTLLVSANTSQYVSNLYYSKVLAFDSNLVYKNPFYGDPQGEAATSQFIGFAQAAGPSIYLKTVNNLPTPQGLVKIDDLNGADKQEYFPDVPNNFNFLPS